MRKAKDGSYPCQITFVEDDRGGKWYGRLMNRQQAIDVETGGLVRGKPFYNITQAAEDRFVVVMQGGSRHGRRYATHNSLTEAQEAGIRWAGRRFRIPV